MARLVVSNGYERALIGGFVASEATQQRQQEERSRFHESVARSRGSEYLERFNDRSRSLDVDRLARYSTAVNRHSRSAFRGDMIMDVENIGDLQHLPRIMQDYLLTDKRLNYLATNQRISAWDRPVDDYRYASETHRRQSLRYQELNDGMLRVCEEDSSDMWVEDFLDLENEQGVTIRSYHEKRTILNARDRILEILGEGLADPTSKENNLL